MDKTADGLGAEGRRYCRSPNVVCREIAGETLLVPVHGSLADMRRLFILEGSGADIWAMLDGERSVAQIGAELSARYGVAAAEAVADVEELLRDLSASGLLAEVAA